MMLCLVYAVLCVNSGLWHGEIERDNLNSGSSVMVQLSKRKRVIGGNHDEKLGLREFRVRVN